jgi:phosphoribosylamine-glycine ligase
LLPIAADQITELVALARRERAEFVVVGPEVPLSLGLVDALEKWTSRPTGRRPTARGSRRRKSSRSKSC